MNEIINIREFIKENNIDKIFLDIDGVVLQSCQAVCDVLNEKYEVNVAGNEITKWDFSCNYPLTKDLVEEVFDNELFFEYVEPMKGVLEFIEEYKDKIVFVTKSSFKNYEQKKLWFDSRKIKPPIIALPFVVNKDIINMKSKNKTLFIDDSTSNLNVSNADYKIQFREYKDDRKREWQEEWQGSVMYNW